MPTPSPTLVDLREAGTITSLEIVAAVDAYVQNPNAGPYRFASGHRIDIASVVAGSTDAAAIMSKSGPKEKVFRTAVTTLVMSARPTPP